MILSLFFNASAAHLAATTANQSNTAMWYLTRATAVSAYVALSVLVALGLLRSTARIAGERLSWVVDEVHQFLGTIFGMLVGAHLLTLLLDPYISFTLANFMLPINEPYSPLAVDFGVIALWSVILVLGSSWLRRHLPYRFWRLLHYLGFVTFVLVTLHGVLAGSDTDMLWMRAVYIGAGVIVGLLVLMRLGRRSGTTSVEARRA